MSVKTAIAAVIGAWVLSSYVWIFLACRNAELIDQAEYGDE